MIDELLQVVAPHYCYGCGQIGGSLCVNCKYDIIDEGFERCIVCASPSPVGICSSCRTSYDKAWCVGERTDALRRSIDALKFERARAVHKSLAELLDERLPVLPAETIVVAVPTIASHIRKRGYDHTKLIARYFARKRNLRHVDALQRTSNTKQLGASRKQRFLQAEAAFSCPASLDSNQPYLLIDDIVTTNATVRYAARELKVAGAKDVWVAVLARQVLDKTG